MKRSLLSGLLYGLIFGFLLQKAGVASFDVLVGALRLTDLTVIKVIGSAIVIGSSALYVLRRFKLVRPHVKPTHYASNVVGGLLFGLGFGISGYCPGTGGAAFGQGNWDAAVAMLGLIAGSYLFALKAPLFKKLNKIGDRGKISIAQALHVHKDSAQQTS